MERAKAPQEVVSCEKTDIDDCMAKLQTFLRLTSLPFTAKAEELDQLCEEAASGYNCTAGMLRSKDCLSSTDKDLVPIFVEMAEYMFFMLCGNGAGTPGYLKEAFLKNSECIIKNKESIQCCARESHIPDLPIVRFVEEKTKGLAEKQITACCPVANFLKCASSKAEESCGEVAGNFTAEYIQRATGEQLQAVCQNMPLYPEPDPKTCQSKPPVCSGGSQAPHLSYELLMFLFAFLCLRSLYVH
ncbi:uncharacterized protein LOC129216120 isoform X2 [Uloborus diversus]|nr:uncharacterized protein LOC129216120 isoform X2 [Uloborus diversus]